MLRPRIMPCLLLDEGSLIKTVRFKGRTHLGDPINAVRIYNECEVDELIVLDINATTRRLPIDFELLQQLASECFMPFTYGGGVANVDDAARLFALGIEKVAVNSAGFTTPDLITRLAHRFGSQAIVASIDVRRPLLAAPSVVSDRGARKHPAMIEAWTKRVVELGAGEILLTSVDRDGTWTGYDLDLIRSVTSGVNVPVIACGGAGALDDVRDAINAGASAAAAGSLFVYQKQGMGVLINFPTPDEIARSLA